jgi:hypothetical protein
MSDGWIGDKSQRQQICYCDRKSVVQLGLRSNPYIDVALFVGVFFILVNILMSQGDLGSKFMLVALFGLLLAWLPFEYFGNKKEMLRAGHSIQCSRRIALQSVLYVGRWGSFFIPTTPEETREIETKLKGRVIDAQMNYGAIAGGLWIDATIVNLLFIFKFVEGGSLSILYPVFFAFTIIVSTVVLIRVRGRKVVALIFSLLNICSSAILFMLYILAALFHLAKF